MKHPYLTYYLLVSLVGLVPAVFGQTGRTLDSLVHRLQQSAHDTNYVLTQNGYAWQLLQRSDFGRADSVLEQAEQLSGTLRYAYGLEKTWYNRALSLYYQDKSGEALPYAQLTLAQRYQIQSLHQQQIKQKDIAD